MSTRRLTEARRSRSARYRFSCVNRAHVSGVEALRAGTGWRRRRWGHLPTAPAHRRSRAPRAPAQITTPSAAARPPHTLDPASLCPLAPPAPRAPPRLRCVVWWLRAPCQPPEELQGSPQVLPPSAGPKPLGNRVALSTCAGVLLAAGPA